MLNPLMAIIFLQQSEYIFLGQAKTSAGTQNRRNNKLCPDIHIWQEQFLFQHPCHKINPLLSFFSPQNYRFPAGAPQEAQYCAPDVIVCPQ